MSNYDEMRKALDNVGKAIAEVGKRFPPIENDVVDHPSHYTDGNIEVIDYIEDKGFGYHLGNAIKYISRAGKKDPLKETEDLRKAVWYIERYIELKEGEQ